ncbi:hypothetical protein DSECCO2_515840 [anaerobic digester metagenome]
MAKVCRVSFCACKVEENNKKQVITKNLVFITGGLQGKYSELGILSRFLNTYKYMLCVNFEPFE